MQPLLEISLSNAIVATLLALVAAAVSRLWRRPVLAHTLWLLVLLKFITPPLLPVPISWPVEQKAATTATVQLPVAESVRLELPADEEPVVALANEERDGVEDAGLPPFPLRTAEAPASWSAPQAVAAAGGLVSRSNADLLLRGALSVWLAGSVLWFALAAVRLFRFHRYLRFGVPAPEGLQERARCLAERLGLASCPTVWILPGRISPLLWSAGGRLWLVLPAGLLKSMRPEQQATLLAHELAHARRRDHWVRWLEFLVIGLYWWHPVAWFARLQLQQAEEECCDAWVVWLLPAAARSYAKALLQTVEFLDARPALPPAASGIGHVHLLKRRLTMIVRQPFCPRLAWPIHLGAVVLGVLILSVAPVRLEAKGLTEPALLVRGNNDADDQKGSKDDLERRLEALEKKMERILQALDRPRSQNRERGEEDAARDAKRRAQENEQRARDAEQRARIQEQRTAERAKLAQQRAAERLKEAAKREKARSADKGKDEKETIQFRFKIDGKEFDVKDMKDLDRKIEEIVKKSVNPEQLRKLEQEIKRTVEKEFNPEKMKQFQKQIKEAMDKEWSPEHVKKLEREIQEMVNKTVNPERMERLARDIEEMVKKSTAIEEKEIIKILDKQKKQAAESEAKLSAEKAKKETAARKRETERSRSRDAGNLEQRLDRLERQMEKVIRALEESQKKRGE